MIPYTIADQFLNQKQTVDIKPFGNGLINDTWLVKADPQPFILQRINRSVFPRPELIMANLEAVNAHLKQCPEKLVNLQFPEIIKAHGEPYYIDEQAGFWRALSLIKNTLSFDNIRTHADAEQVGFALGHFHRLLSSLDSKSLHDTLPGFHITPEYLAYYNRVLNGGFPVNNNTETEFCQNFITRYKHLAGILENAKRKGLLTLRIVHGDPKLDNILFDRDNHKAISIIDLDTTKPGLVHYDIGDCLRSCCSTFDNESTAVQFDLEICSAILKNYLDEAQVFFTPQDYNFIFTAIQLIPFELGLRFFTDYLEGNKYFKVTEPEQNLQRALNQFQLMESINRQQSVLEKMISNFKPGQHRFNRQSC